MKHKLSVIGGALLLSLATSVQAKDTITIGVPVGLSGANSVVAPSVVQSAELAVEEINAKGGIMGKKVALEVADDGSGAAGAQKAFDSLIFQKKVDVLISMETSAARNAGLPIVTRGKTPFIYTSFYEGRSCNKYLFVNAWVPDQQVVPIVDYFMKKHNAKTYFLVGSDYAFGRGMLQFTRSYIEKKGGKVLGEVRAVAVDAGRARGGNHRMLQFGRDQLVEFVDELVNAFRRKIEPEEFDRDEPIAILVIRTKDGS